MTSTPTRTLAIGTTPGPWTIQTDYERIIIRAEQSGFMIVCSVGNGGMTSDHKPTVKRQTAYAKANAALIAAAPDMLAALTVAADTLQAFDPGDQSTETGWAHDELLDAWNQCQAAIAKATA